jgi:hypothetical protein
MARRKLTARANLARERRKSKKLGYSLTAARQKRERAQSKAFVERAKKLAPFVPSLKKVSRKKRLTQAEKSEVTRYTKKLKYARNLHPVTKKQAKKLKGQLYAPGVQAIQLDDVSSTAKLGTIGNDLLISSNGRTWIYWKLDKETVRSKAGMKGAGKKAFDKKFPIERIAEMAERAFKTYNVKQIHLWGHSGRVGPGFQDFGAFMLWVNEKWQAGRYIETLTSAGGREYENPSDPGKWINGLAIWIEPKE